MELNARHSLAFAVIVINECSGIHCGSVDFTSSCCLIISQHFKIVLEHIDDFVRLKSFFDSEGHSVEELIKFITELLSFFFLLLSLFLHILLIIISNEVVSRVLYRLINTPSKDSLCLNSFHLVSCLKTHVKDLLFSDVVNVLDHTLQVHGVLTGFFFGQVKTFLSVLFSGSRYSHLEFRP